MKIVSIPTLVLALVVLASTCIAFTPTSEDMAWRTAAINDSAMIKSDAGHLRDATSSLDRTSLQKYVGLLDMDAGNALRKSQAYNISPELLNAKNYYEQGLSSFQNGARKISQSLTLFNPTMMQPGLDDIDKGNEYMERAAQELKTVAG